MLSRAGRVSSRGAVAELPQRAQRRFAGSYQSNQWLFNDYWRPAAAKHWLAQYPQQEEEADAYPAEYVYLDEVEDRIEQYHEQFQNSEKFDRLYNEYAWVDHDNPVKSYGVSGGKREAGVHGRGQKISPEHYFPPTFHEVPRVPLAPVQYMSGENRQLQGELNDVAQLPPEEPSVMKFWGAYQLMGTLSVLLVSKEFFLMGHDMVHASLEWTAISMIVSLSIDTWYWWYALRLQEEYDRKFFPMNERVNKLYDILDTMESNGSYVNMAKSFDKYARSLGQASIDRKVAAMKSEQAGVVIERLDSVYKQEQTDLKNAERQWNTQAYDQTLAFFSEPKNTKPYIQQALAVMKTGDNASLAAGAERGKSTTSAFADKYASLYTQVKTQWFTDQKKAGTLPWSMQDEKDRKAAALTPKAKTDLLDGHLKELRGIYHNFA